MLSLSLLLGQLGRVDRAPKVHLFVTTTAHRTQGNTGTVSCFPNPPSY